ncbi:MAG: phage tail protein, partial [Symbiopectobacterium sp.]
ANNGLAWGEGTSSSVGEGAFTRLEANILSNNNLGSVGCQYTFDASKVVPTATENRPRNIAFNYIVRAA